MSLSEIRLKRGFEHSLQYFINNYWQRNSQKDRKLKADSKL